jgi:hypothetical protein
VTAYDPYNNVATGYRGTVHFTSSDNRASLPNTYTFVARDGGVHTFRNSVTLRASGTQTIKACDVLKPSVNGRASVTVGTRSVPDVLAIGGSRASVRGQVREAITPRARRSKQRAARIESFWPTPANAGPTWTVAQKDAARDAVLPEIRRKLHAYLLV